MLLPRLSRPWRSAEYLDVPADDSRLPANNPPSDPPTKGVSRVADLLLRIASARVSFALGPHLAFLQMYSHPRRVGVVYELDALSL